MIGDVDDDSMTHITLLLLLVLPSNAHYLSMRLPAYIPAPLPSLHPCQQMLLPALSLPLPALSLPLPLLAASSHPPPARLNVFSSLSNDRANVLAKGSRTSNPVSFGPRIWSIVKKTSSGHPDAHGFSPRTWNLEPLNIAWDCAKDTRIHHGRGLWQLLLLQMRRR